MSAMWMFPYELVNKNDRVILYGGGKVGKSFVKQIDNNHFCNIVAIADKNYKNLKQVMGINVIPPQEIVNYEYDNVVISVANGKDDIAKGLKSLGIDGNKIILSDFLCFGDECAETAETQIIRTVFDALGIKTPSYIDAGACHPHLSSNTMAFYENGSRGINIEANISLKNEFEIYRPEDINLFVGLAKEPGEMMFYKADSPYLNTFSSEAMKWHEKHFNAKYEPGIKIEVTTLNDIVEKYAGGVFPDFLDIDIEGMDEEVLRYVDFSNSSPLLICTEGFMPTFNKFLINKKCEGDGYMPYCRVESNSIYLRKDIYKKVLSL